LISTGERNGKGKEVPLWAIWQASGGELKAQLEGSASSGSSWLKLHKKEKNRDRKVG